MIVYRLSKRAYVDDLSGKGAAIAGGRWNSKERKVLYTSESRALCMAEIAVHTPLGIIPTDYYLSSVFIPDDIEVYRVNPERLPKNWKEYPPIQVTKKIGDNFLISNNYLVMKVPSAVVQGDWNYFVNPEHPRFSEVKVMRKEKFDFDKRMFK
jgi:RES domain-containing protein